MNSKPSMTGIFQSSSTASGSSRLQISSACAPSSASRIRKFMSSRIRLAIFRMTLESSTTRHVFISLTSSAERWDSLGGKGGFGREFEDAIDVEDDHELAVEPVDAAGELGHAGIEVDGVFLAAGFGQAQHFADGVDQKAIGFAAQVDADRHRRLALVVLRQP